jgi:hypothetical protein
LKESPVKIVEHLIGFLDDLLQDETIRHVSQGVFINAGFVIRDLK